MNTQHPGDGTRPDNPEPERSSASEHPATPAAADSERAGARSAPESAPADSAEAQDQSASTSSVPGTTPDSGAPSETGAPSDVDWSTPGSVPPGAASGTEGLAGLGAAPGTPGPPRRGSVQRQEAGVTKPRPPTVAEARARDKARKHAEQAQQAAAAAEESKKRKRKRVMIGGVAIVGVAGLVGGGYLAYRALTAPDRVTAHCVKTENGQEIVVDDDHCGDGRPGFVSNSGGGPGVIILGGGPQYRYYYGGTGTVGKPPTGGTTVKPRSAEIKTKSGTTVQRGGLGSKSTGGGS
ncbi:hypothetical protein OH799_14805 [Nocardia sp. NBC_00881]|uniref:hypothetical protein n=1 Tax=Nocardia sp. NBC_00881 TaxID=2975995 RepID=UPI003863E9D4|nr:hypothetical protein OH799_14805 [Nocardia sp. NBC_00881]